MDDAAGQLAFAALHQVDHILVGITHMIGHRHIQLPGQFHLLLAHGHLHRAG